ncbi:MAG: hypothetical protein ACRDNW_13030 [Trebonia sp.]
MRRFPVFLRVAAGGTGTVGEGTGPAAEVHADPDLHEAVTRPIDDAGPVPMPTGDDG